MKHTITFLPDNITATVDKGENLLNAAAQAGVYIHAYCGGDGICGKCKVIVNKGEVRSDKANLKQEDWNGDIAWPVCPQWNRTWKSPFPR